VTQQQVRLGRERYRPTRRNLSSERDHLSVGIHYTIVNGQVEFDREKLTGATVGHILRGRV
jgi:hypothetical protein